MKCPRCHQKIRHPDEPHGRTDHGAQVECAPPLNTLKAAFVRAGIDATTLSTNPTKEPSDDHLATAPRLDR